MNKVLIVTGAVMAALVAFVPPVRAQREPERPSLPNFDKRASLPPEVRLAPPGRVAAEERLRGMLPDARVDVDRFTQAPQFIHSRHGFLSGPDASGGAIPAQTAAAFGANDPHRAVKAFVSEHRDLFGHGTEALDAAFIKRDYVTPHNGLRTVVWHQQVDGIDVLDAKFVGHITQKGQLVNISSRFVPDPVVAANAGLPNRVAALAELPISAAQAVVNAAAGIEEQVALPDVLPGRRRC